MIHLPQKAEKRPLETTISLINIVFLMLIFFLVAGQLAPPQDSNVDLSRAAEAPPLPPPDALYVRRDGSLVYRGEAVTAAAYFAIRPPSDREDDRVIRLGADANLLAGTLLDHVSAIYAAGAARVVIVTRTGDE